MKLFGRRSGREESRPALARGAQAFGQASTWPLSYEAQTREGYGNRIPSLTFEVVADYGPVASGAVARALAEEVRVAEDGLMLGGFVAEGGSVRAVLETLAAASGAWFAADGAFRTGGAALRTVVDAGFGKARGVRAIAAAGSAPGVVAVAHYDAARDYQAGLQRARFPGGGVREERVEVAAVLDPAAAKSVAEAVLARREAERMRRTVAAGLDALDVAPGAVVRVAGEAGTWRVTRTSLEAMAVVLDLVPVVATQAAGTASGGRVLAEVDAVAGRTVVHAFEVPALDDALLSRPRLLVAAAGEGAGWRSAALLVSTDAGATWDEAGGTAAPAVIGTVETPPGRGGALLADMISTLVVRTAHAGMLLSGADDLALDRGANLALAGGELVQFGRAEALGDRRWRLSRLLRGRRGTEWAAGMQAAGDRFVLLEPGTVRTVALPLGASAARVLASGVGDDVAIEANAALDGGSVRPPSVARLAWEAGAPGEAIVRWVRRSRIGWRWSDGADVALGEELERYLVTVTRSDGTVTSEVREAPSAVVPRGATVDVRQRGTLGDSRSATIAVPA